MNTFFDPTHYIKTLADQLVSNFDLAGSATTPGLVGAAREQEVRSKLEMLIPNRMQVSTGCGIDSYGSASRQLDVIIHEKDNCPAFSLSGSKDTVYLPCENIAAAGEIKSKLGNKELEDAVQKIRSVKLLRRSMENNSNFRRYGSSLITAGSTQEEYSQENNLHDQIYGFILCRRFLRKIDATANYYAELCTSNNPAYSPSILISLEDGIIMLSGSEGQLVRNAVDAKEAVHFHHPGGNFQYLLSEIIDICQTGRTTDSMPNSLYILGKHRNSLIYPTRFPIS